MQTEEHAAVIPTIAPADNDVCFDPSLFTAKQQVNFEGCGF
jgi:hypothetical protein